MRSLTVINLAEAKFDCTFGRGCDGVCCRNGRPHVGPTERERIDLNLDKIMPHLRPVAQAMIPKEGYVSRRRRLGEPILRVVDGWCIFFNEGCVLHKVGKADGDPFQYKPFSCALFPLDKDDLDRWYVRQKGFDGEIWELPCLSPGPDTPRAIDSLGPELALAIALEAETEAEAKAAQALVTGDSAMAPAVLAAPSMTPADIPLCQKSI